MNPSSSLAAAAAMCSQGVVATAPRDYCCSDGVVESNRTTDWTSAATSLFADDDDDGVGSAASMCSRVVNALPQSAWNSSSSSAVVVTQIGPHPTFHGATVGLAPQRMHFASSDNGAEILNGRDAVVRRSEFVGVGRQSNATGADDWTTVDVLMHSSERRSAPLSSYGRLPSGGFSDRCCASDSNNDGGGGESRGRRVVASCGSTSPSNTDGQQAPLRVQHGLLPVWRPEQSSWDGMDLQLQRAPMAGIGRSMTAGGSDPVPVHQAPPHFLSQRSDCDRAVLPDDVCRSSGGDVDPCRSMLNQVVVNHATLSSQQQQHSAGAFERGDASEAAATAMPVTASGTCAATATTVYNSGIQAYGGDGILFNSRCLRQMTSYDGNLYSESTCRVVSI